MEASYIYISHIMYIHKLYKYIIIIVISGVGLWKRGLSWLPLLSAPPHLSYTFYTKLY